MESGCLIFPCSVGVGVGSGVDFQSSRIRSHQEDLKILPVPRGTVFAFKLRTDDGQVLACSRSTGGWGGGEFLARVSDYQVDSPTPLYTHTFPLYHSGQKEGGSPDYVGHLARPWCITKLL